ncbi:Na(+)/H(+) antiporter [Paramagnetospirillum magnetotacticum MS-1]|uniref:Na(+)/H(+) antiporter n=1 Tax=Paramagnetospirillum magnetotacticum MS-1 TaxID=272627 RepID=A0A0C2YVA4_PARME|nr:cation:proton antiporter [Paramagnetospirillum magnetotacticum]KIL99058.1 Na(+)/H(+) antiporter [Paramagnetospirillum magnetotacticum MS-1]
MSLFLIQTALIIGLPYGLWRMRLIGRLMPLAAVQMAVGIALGPSLLGWASPELAMRLFPPASLLALDGLVRLAVVFFAFSIGLHFDLARIRGQGRCFSVLALSSVVVPSLAGAVGGWWLFAAIPDAAGFFATRPVFAAAMGIAAGVTALPVLGAVVREMGLEHHKTGVMAIGAAAFNDAALWVAVALLLALSRGGDLWEAGQAALGALLFAGFLFWVVRPLLRRLFAHAEASGRVGAGDVVLLTIGLALASLVTEILGLHAVIGAFVFGAVMPRKVAQAIVGSFETFVQVVLLPFFFISVGLKTRIDLGGGALTIFWVMSAAAILGKLVSALPAWMGGCTGREALTLGGLLTCKGLMELVVLTLLADTGLISETCFGAMVLMALFATALTKPLAGMALPHDRAIARTHLGQTPDPL